MTTNKADKNSTNKMTLLLAIVAGMCGDALLSGFTMDQVSFSIFPLIALVLAVHALYQRYITHPVSEDMPLITVACFFIGGFGHAAFIKAFNPEAGSNFFYILIAMILIAWVAKRLGVFTTPPKYPNEAS